MKNTYRLLCPQLIILMKAILLLPCFSHGQELPQLNSTLLQIDLGMNHHGTGDLRGYGFNLEAFKAQKRRFTTSIGLGSLISQGTSPLYYKDASGTDVDASYRITTASFQVSGKLGLSWVRTQKFDLGTRIGLLARYQSSSFFSEHGVYYPVVTGIPIPLSNIVQSAPQNTLALGGIAQMYLNYRVNKSSYIGLNTSWQIDTQGDAIAQVMLNIGFRVFYE